MSDNRPHGTRRCRRRRYSFLALRDRSQHISRARNIRQINFCFDFILAAEPARAQLAGLRRTFCRGTEVDTNFFRFVLFQRTRVRFLFCNSDQRKRVENSFALHFQLSGKIVDANLTHPAFRFSAL
jgi:hypothetical protein